VRCKKDKSLTGAVSRKSVCRRIHGAGKHQVLYSLGGPRGKIRGDAFGESGTCLQQELNGGQKWRGSAVIEFVFECGNQHWGQIGIHGAGETSDSSDEKRNSEGFSRLEGNGE